MEDYYEYLDSNGVTTLYKLIKDDTVALIDSYSVTINGITTTLDTHVNNTDIHTPISDIESMVDTKISGLVNSAPETLDTLKELSDALGADPNFATTVANQIGTKADKDSVYTKQETDTLLESKANSVHSHVVNDITDFPTIPTKTSELSNDSNFVTSTELHDYATKNDLNSKQDALSEEQLSNIDSIPDKANKSDLSTVATSGSYKDLLDKPVIPEGADLSDYYNKGETDNLLNSKANTSDLAVVAKSGNYNDLNNTPAIPTKLSQLENDMGFGTGGDTSDCVHKTGNETIAGIKTFTNGTWVTNNSTTSGYSIKLNAIARNDVPSQLYHATFRAHDKNNLILGEYCVEKSTTGASLLHMNVRSEDSNGKQLSESLYLNMSNDGSTVRFYPSSNNKMDLGMSNNKWANAYIDRVVCTRFTHSVNNGSVYITGGSEYNKGATLALHGEESSDAGSFVISSRDKTRSLYLVGKPDGTLQWAGHNIALDSNLVHRSGDETINGTKTFTVGPVTSNNATTNGYFIKLNTIARNDVPSQLYHATFRTLDKNSKILGEYCIEKSNSGSTLAQINVRSEDANGKQISKSVYFNMSNDGTKTAFHPNVTNVVDLGMSNYKWAKIYSDDVVHTSGNETINGTKTFSNQIYLGAGGTSYGQISAKDNNSILRLFGGTSAGTGANLDLYGEGLSSGGFSLRARTSDKIVGLDGKTDGTLKWNGKNVALDENLVHRSGAETIDGTKTFTQGINIKKSDIDLTITPTSNKYSTYFFTDKNNKLLGVVQYAQRTTDVNDLDLYVYDKNSSAHGIQITTNNELSPIGNNYSLGSSSGHKWANVYATTFNGNLKGNADTATYATTQATTDNSTKIATTAWVRTYVNSVAGSGSVGASISAYYSNATTLTAEGNPSSSGGSYPSDYSDYINISPKVGTIYTGSQLFSTVNASASGSEYSYGTSSGLIYQTTAKATANFSGAFSSSAKYLCTTANAVRFRAYVSHGTPSNIGTASVVDNSSTKSIFIRVE